MNSTTKAQILKEFEDTGILRQTTYAKKEVEGELRKFENMISEFEGLPGASKISDIQAHILALAEEKGLLDDPKIIKFNEMTNELNKLIAMEIAGNKGEHILSYHLKLIRVKNRSLMNLELSSDDFKTEIDGVVITSKAIFLIEVKHSSQDIYISPQGSFYRANDCKKSLFNIAHRMDYRAHMLRNTILQSGFKKKIKIYKILVFTNHNCAYVNKYKNIRACTVIQLPKIIQRYRVSNLYDEEDMNYIQDSLRKASKVKQYAIAYDFGKYIELYGDVSQMTDPKTPEVEYVDKNCGECVTMAAYITNFTIFKRRKNMEKNNLTTFVVSYNAAGHAWKLSQESWASRLQRSCNYIRETAPGAWIIGLSEVIPGRDDKYLAILQKAFPEYILVTPQAYRKNSSPRSAINVLLIHREGYRYYATRTLKDLENSLLYNYVEIDTDHGYYRVLNLHIPHTDNGDRPIWYQQNRIDLRKKFEVALKATCRSYTQNLEIPFILLGDFNATPDGSLLQELTNPYGPCLFNATLTRNWVTPTYINPERGSAHLDGIFYSTGAMQSDMLAVRENQILREPVDEKMSDHCMILGQIVMRYEEPALYWEEMEE